MHDNASNTDEVQIDIRDEIDSAFGDVEEFERRNSPAVKGLLQGIRAEPEVVLACDSEQNTNSPFVYVQVFDAVDSDAVGVVMEFLHVPDRAFVGQAGEVYSALRELAENDYCWTVKDTYSIAETYIEDTPYE